MGVFARGAKSAV